MAGLPTTTQEVGQRAELALRMIEEHRTAMVRARMMLCSSSLDVAERCLREIVVMAAVRT